MKSKEKAINPFGTQAPQLSNIMLSDIVHAMENKKKSQSLRGNRRTLSVSKKLIRAPRGFFECRFGKSVRISSSRTSTFIFHQPLNYTMRSCLNFNKDKFGRLIPPFSIDVRPEMELMEPRRKVDDRGRKRFSFYVFSYFIVLHERILVGFSELAQENGKYMA